MDSITSHSPEETFEAGRQLAAQLRAGDTLALRGDLGAGKTPFVKGLAAGLGAADAVTSPTFTLIHEYRGGRLPLYHADLYRLENPDQVYSTGLEEYFGGDGITAIEWADKFPELLPPGARWIQFETGESDTRVLRFEHPTKSPI